MTDVNHLQQAKDQFEIICNGGIEIPSPAELMKAHALIAIAEQLKISNHLTHLQMRSDGLELGKEFTDKFYRLDQEEK